MIIDSYPSKSGEKLYIGCLFSKFTMAVVAIKIKALPESPDINLDELKSRIKTSLENAGAIKINSIEEEPLAFGLMALIIFFAWPEEKETSLAEDAVRVEGVSSIELIDYRRAFG